MDDLSNLSLEELQALHSKEVPKDEFSNLTLDDIKKIHEREVGHPTQKPSTPPGTWTETFRNIRDRLHFGSDDPLVGAAQNLAHSVGVPDQITEGVDALVKAREHHYDKTLAPHGDGFLANLDVARPIGSAATSFATGGPLKSLSRSIGNGMLDGFLQPQTAEGSHFVNKAIDAGMGGAFGGLMHGASGLIDGLINPNTANDMDLKKLLDSGVLPSIGQAMGEGRLNDWEQKLTGIPFVGDAIRNLRKRGLETWNTATMNEAIKPSGYKVTEGGHEGVGQMEHAAEKAYDWALGHMKEMPSDAQHLNELRSIDDAITALLTRGDSFREKLNVTRNIRGDLTGESFKGYDKTYRGMIEDALNGDSIDKDFIFPIAKDLRMANRNLLDRISPSSKSLLDDADRTYAGIKTVEQAMKNASNNDGVFTPKQLGVASRQAASSPLIVAKGDGMLQDWANIGNKYVGNNVPDSGSPSRMMAMTMDPLNGLTLAAASNFGEHGLNDAIVKMISSRPDWAKKLSKGAKDWQVDDFIKELAGGLSHDMSPFGGR